jgi:hypothetical protein
MNYNANTKQLEIKLETLEIVSHELRYVLRCIRELADLPMDRYKRGGPLSRADHAQKAVLDAARIMGIDFGARWGDELDLREADDIDGQNAKGMTRGLAALEPESTNQLDG